jgi:hypothetical protein
LLTTKNLYKMKTPMQELIDELESTYHLTEETKLDFKKFLEKEQQAFDDKYTIGFMESTRNALSQPTADLDKMAQYRKDLESMPIASLEQTDLDELRKEFDKFYFSLRRHITSFELFDWFTSRLPIQKPVESDAVSIKITTLKEWIDRIKMYEYDLKTSLFLKEDIKDVLPPIQTR